MRLHSIFVVVQLSVSLFHLRFALAFYDRGQFRRTEQNRQLAYSLHGVKRLVNVNGIYYTKARTNHNKGKTISIVDSSILDIRGGEAATTTMTGSTTASPDNSAEESPLAKLRRTVFPIYGEEVKKFFLISSIKFYIILALTLTRDTKDTLVVTQCGAEAIAFLKVCTVFSF